MLSNSGLLNFIMILIVINFMQINKAKNICECLIASEGINLKFEEAFCLFLLGQVFFIFIYLFIYFFMLTLIITAAFMKYFDIM